MLKISILLVSLVVFSACIKAQTVSDKVNGKELVLQKGEIPDAFAKSVTDNLVNDEPPQWTSISDLVKPYGMTSLKSNDVDYSPDEYYVKVKTTSGNVYNAVYNRDGHLVLWKAELKDGHLPEFIQSKLEKNNYSDWRVLSDVGYIKEYKNNAEKYYVVKIKKGSQKKTLYFDDSGALLTEK